jgi:transcriptional regulator with XRE-family HTH domain
MANNLSKRIKAFRLSKEMNQVEAAVVLGISIATLQRIESGSSEGSDLSRARIENRLKNLSERETVAA